MEITWKHSFQQVEEILGVTDKPWIVNPFWEMDVSAQLDGKQLGELPMEKMGDGTPAQGWFERAIVFWKNVT